MRIIHRNGRKIRIRSISRNDLNKVDKFLDFVNSLVDENAMIFMKYKKTFAEEKSWLWEKIKSVERSEEVALIAEGENEIVGITSISSHTETEDHVGELSIAIKDGYRGFGLGGELTKEILKEAKERLKVTPKVVRLSVFSNNDPAIKLYEKMGFKVVAKIPKQIQYEGRLLDEVVMMKEL